jgi:hypothetical protein
MGFVPNNPSSEMVIYKARELYPKFPGIIDFSCWEIGRKYCHVSKPDCRNCIVNFECKNKTINIEDELKNIIGFSFSSGGFHVEYKTIKIDIEDNKIICKYISEINDNRGERIFEITNSIWNNFIKSIIKLNILKWDKEYDDPYIRDGIQWNIEIKYKNKSVEIYGNNRYPREWNNFIKTIEKYFLLIK